METIEAKQNDLNGDLIFCILIDMLMQPALLAKLPEIMAGMIASGTQGKEVAQ